MKALLLWALMTGASAVLADSQVIDVSMPDLNGRQQTLSQYRGKWVVVNYWATTCPPCIKEMPELSSFHNKHKDKDAVVVGVDFENIPKLWLDEFLNRVDVDYPIWLGGTSPFTPFGKVMALPTTFIINPKGELTGRHTGVVTQQALEAFIESKK